MKIYIIADRNDECYGHGSYGTEYKICRQGDYGTGKFPPAFKTKKGAREYLDNNEKKFLREQKVVELDYYDW